MTRIIQRCHAVVIMTRGAWYSFSQYIFRSLQFNYKTGTNSISTHENEYISSPWKPNRFDEINARISCQYQSSHNANALTIQMKIANQAVLDVLTGFVLAFCCQKHGSSTSLFLYGKGTNANCWMQYSIERLDKMRRLSITFKWICSIF